LPHLCLCHSYRQGWQAKAANLRPLVDQATVLMKAFGRDDLIEVPATKSSACSDTEPDVAMQPIVTLV